MKRSAAWLSKHRVFHWVAFTICLLAIWYLVSNRMPRVIVTYGDSVQYWAAGRLSILRENPYSAEQVLKLRAEAGTSAEFPTNAVSMLLYPPWTIPFLLPLGTLSYAQSRLLWFLFHLIILFISARLIWQLYGGERRNHWVAYLMAFCFWPALYILLLGHITTLHLLGLIGFLYFIARPGQRAWNDIAAGACAALVTFKPQLLFLFMLALLLWIIQQRRWLVLVGGAGIILLASALAVLVDPPVFAQFWEALNAYAVGAYASPALGTVLRRFLGYQREWLQLLPLLLGLIWFVYYWGKHHRFWDWFAQMPVLILASFLTSAYMWPYDMVVLLLPVLQVTIALIKSQAHGSMIAMFAAYLGINVLVFYQFIAIHNDYYAFWLVPVLLAWCLLGNHLARPGLNLQSSQQ